MSNSSLSTVQQIAFMSSSPHAWQLELVEKILPQMVKDSSLSVTQAGKLLSDLGTLAVWISESKQAMEKCQICSKFGYRASCSQCRVHREAAKQFQEHTLLQSKHMKNLEELIKQATNPKAISDYDLLSSVIEQMKKSVIAAVRAGQASIEQMEKSVLAAVSAGQASIEQMEKSVLAAVSAGQASIKQLAETTAILAGTTTELVNKIDNLVTNSNQTNKSLDQISSMLSSIIKPLVPKKHKKGIRVISADLN